MLKYNWSIIGHEKQLKMLEHDVESGNLSHAYLLVGSDSVGKYTVAKKLAGILQCENNFCHKCSACIQLQNGSHLDTIEFTGNSGSIGIDAIRDLIGRLNMTRQSPYKITLIDGIERMTTEASNSFLKILEEPPSKTIFIMTTSEFKDILPTIVSRVRIIKFQSVSVEYLNKEMGKLYPDSDPETINQASLFSLGKTGKAVQLMDNPALLAGYIKMYHDVQNFLERKNIADRFAYVENLCPPDLKKSPAALAQLRMFFEILSHVLRTKMLFSPEASIKYTNALSKIDEADILLRNNINAKLVLENLLLSL